MSQGTTRSNQFPWRAWICFRTFCAFPSSCCVLFDLSYVWRVLPPGVVHGRPRADPCVQGLHSRSAALDPLQMRASPRTGVKPKTPMVAGARARETRDHELPRPTPSPFPRRPLWRRAPPTATITAPSGRPPSAAPPTRRPRVTTMGCVASGQTSAALAAAEQRRRRPFSGPARRLKRANRSWGRRR